MSATRRQAAALLAAVTLTLPATRAQTQLLGTDLSGTWVLNEALSDDPKEVLEKKRDELRARGGSPGGGSRGGFGGGSAGGPPMRSSGNQEQMQARLQGMKPPQKIVILQNDLQITMIPEGRDTLTIVPDGKKHKQKTAVGDVEIEATWVRLDLELKTKGSEGGEMKRVYRINDDGRLEIVTELELPRAGDKVEIVMRYDPSS